MSDYKPILVATAAKYGLDPNLAQRVMHVESRGNPNAVSPAGAIGPMQLMPGTARELGVDPHDPVQNIDGGVRYLKKMVDQFGPALGPAAYNAGPGRVSSYLAGRGTLPQETQNYMKLVNGEAPQMENNRLPYGVYQDSSLGEVRSQKLKQEGIDALNAMNNERKSVLPIALGAMLSSNRGAQNFGNNLYDFAVQGLNPMALAHGKVMPDGTYLTDDSTQQLRADAQAMREDNAKQIRDQRAEDNAPANVVTDENGQQVVDPNAPWKGLRHKESITMRNQTMNAANKELDKLREAYGGDVSTMQGLDQFSELNKRNKTGGWLYDKWAPDWAHTGEHSAMVALQNKMTPLQRPAGSGATSDFEQRMYKMGIPNVSNDGETNAQIRLATQAMIDVRAARLKHHEEYLAKYGHLNGAESHFAPQIKAIQDKYQPMIDAHGDNPAGRVQAGRAQVSNAPKKTAAGNGGFSIEPADK